MSSTRVASARAPWAITAFCLLTPIFSTGGGLALSPLLALTGLAAFPPPAAWKPVFKPDVAGWLFGGLLIWTAITQLWSPSDPEQLILIWLGTLLYGAAVLAAANLDEAQRRVPRAAVVAMLLGLAFMLLIEVFTAAGMTRMTKDLDLGDPLAFRNVSRAASIYVMLLGPVAALAILQAPKGRWIAGALLLAGIPIAGSFDMLANLLALVAGLVVFVAALWRPVGVLTGVGVISALWIILFPFGVALLEPMSEAQRAALPFSWEWRLETWIYGRELIGQKPILGWGMDAARTFDETETLRGYLVERMPLHPHSAALQLWLETGVIGALLAAGAVATFGAQLAQRLQTRKIAAAGAAAGMTAVLVLAAVSYGVWQEWFWAVAFFGALILMLALPAKRRAA